MRFPGFTEEWEEKEFKEIVKINQGLQIAISQRLLKPKQGALFYITNEFLNPKSEKRFYIENASESVICNEDDILMTRTGNTGKVVTNVSGAFHNNFFRIAYPTYINKDYLYNFLILPKTQNYILRVAGTSTIPDLNHSDFYKIKFKYPSFSEQSKIAASLSLLDERIQTQSKIIEGLKLFKKGMVQKIFKQEIRFKKDDGGSFPKWEKRKFSEILFEHNLKSTGKEEVHSVSVHKGVINQIEHLGRSFAAKNTDHYNRALPNDIIYTKSPTGDFPLGIIKQNHIKNDVILSPLYGVFTPETKELGYILHEYFESPINTSNYLSSIIQKGAKNTINITNKTFLSKKIILPISKREQQKIALALSAVDKKIELETSLLEQLKTQKQYFLQNLFI